jgi:uracil-DNA glycosylase family 4
LKVSEKESCKGCPMLKVDCTYEKGGRKIHHVHSDMNFVPPQIGPTLRLALARDPGETENETGIPLSGAAGKFYDSLLRKAGVDRQSLTVLNCRMCRPPNNIDPLSPQARFFISEADAKKATEQCWKNHVKPVLESRPWERIDALGGEALEALTGKKGIEKWRGSPLPLKGEIKPKVIGTYHPSFIMVYGQGAIPAVISDLKKGLTIPPEFYNTKPTMDDVAGFRSTRFALDIETNRFTQQIICVGLADRPYHAMCVPFRGNYIAETKRIVENAEEITTHNGISFDMPRLCAALGIKDLKAREFDTILGHHLISPDSPHDLGYVASIFLQKPYWKDEIGQDLEYYCCKDVDGTLQIANQIKPILKSQKLEDLYWYTQVPLAKICHLMETTGIHTSGKRANEIRAKLLQDIEELELTLPEGLKPYDKPIRVRKPAAEGTLGKSGKPIKFVHIPGTERVTPWTSPKRVEQYLYHTLGLPAQLNAKSKRVTTDKTALEKLANKQKDPLIKAHIQAVRKLRGLAELASSFIKGMKDEDGHEIPARDGKVAPHFSPYGTSGGRLSSSGPNMQNQPPAARYIYVPSDPNWCLIEADFSQGENRLTAWYANDQERLQRLSTPGFSEHKLNAEIFFGVPYGEVVKDNSPDAPYGRAKKLTHGINYGEGPRKIAMNLDLPEKDVRDWLYKWRVANRPTVDWMEKVSGEAEHNGVLTNAFSRKRWFWTQRLYGESLSFLPQSTLADIMHRAAIGMMYERIGWPAQQALKASSVLAPLPWPARLLMQVHDSFVLEAPAALVPEVVRCIKAVMEQPWPQLGGFSVPAEFSVAPAGMSWGETKPYKLED